MAINLEPARLAIERLMSDRVRLYRNPGGVEDDVLASAPGDLSLSPSLPPAYYDGPGIVRISQVAEKGASGTVPLAVIVEREDRLEIVESRDPESPGRWFRVDQVQGGAFSISRKLVIEEVPAP